MNFLEHTYGYEDFFPSPDTSKLLIRYFWRIYNMVHRQNFNFLAMIVGKHRTGKSLTAINFADLLDKKFIENLEGRVVYTPKQFIHALDVIRKEKQVGSCIVWDESGIGYGSRDWHTHISRVLGHEIQALGYLRPIIFFVTQDMSFLDAQPRKLLHGVYEVERYNNDYSDVKPFFLEYNTWNSRTYRHYPIYVGRHDESTLTPIFKIKRLRVEMPPEDMVKRYEQHSQKFKDLTLNDVKTEIEEYEKLGEPTENISLEEIVNKILEDPTSYKTSSSTPEKPVLHKGLIISTFGITHIKANTVKHLAEKRLQEKQR